MEAYTSTLPLSTCPHNALESNLKLIPGFWAYFVLILVDFGTNWLYLVDKPVAGVDKAFSLSVMSPCALKKDDLI